MNKIRTCDSQVVCVNNQSASEEPLFGKPHKWHEHIVRFVTPSLTQMYAKCTQRTELNRSENAEKGQNFAANKKTKDNF